MQAVRSILRQASRGKDDPYNILTFPTHERQNSMMALTGDNYYAWHSPGIKKWNPIYAPVPSNYSLLNERKQNAQLPEWVDFDFILCQSNAGQFQVAQQISKIYHLPILKLEHTTVMPTWNQGYIEYMHKHLRGHLNVFITEWSRDQWHFTADESFVVEHGVDTDVFKPDSAIEKKRHILTVANEYPQREWCLGFSIYQNVARGLPTHPVGDSPGFSKPAESVAALVQEYQEAGVFLNTSTFSPVPTSLLEAMACGCAVVSTATSAIPTIIENGVNGYITNDKVEMRRLLLKLLDNKEEAARLGEAARKTVVDRFNIPRFVADWKKVFKLAAEYIYIG